MPGGMNSCVSKEALVEIEREIGFRKEGFGGLGMEREEEEKERVCEREGEKNLSIPLLTTVIIA